jgi:hypothetical protein
LLVLSDLDWIWGQFYKSLIVELDVVNLEIWWVGVN